MRNAAGVHSEALDDRHHGWLCSTQDEPIIAAVISLDRQLEGARFAQFWTEVDQLRDVVNPVVGFYDAVREFIVYLIESTFSASSTSNLAQAVRLDGSSLENLVRYSCGSWDILYTRCGGPYR